MEPRPFSRGYIPIQPPLTFLGSPSMEPRPFSRGYVKTSSEVSAQPISFNGATAFQPWIRSPLPCAATQDTPSMEPRPFSRGYIRKKTQTGGICVAFNGATAFQPWILRPDGSPAQCACSLQWSHGLSAVDTPRARCGRRHNPDPSMEPRPFSRGYVALPHILDDARFYLQWSHGLSAVDTVEDGVLVGWFDRPSMEPRPFSRGYASVNPAFCAAFRPSMEPRPFSRGYGRTRSR